MKGRQRVIQYLEKWLVRLGFIRRQALPVDPEHLKQIYTALKDNNQAVGEKDWFWRQMETIAEGKRKHPAMMTSLERHLQTVAEIQKLDWTGFADNHGVCSGFKGIRFSVRVKGSAQDFLSLLTPDEQDKLRKFIREEMAEASSKQKNSGEWK